MKRDDENAQKGQSALAFMTERELASRWKISARTLQRWRKERYGPAWASIGGSIRYPEASVLAYETAHLRGGRSS